MDGCEHCRLDKVSLEDLFSCTCLSIQNLSHDLSNGKSLTGALLRDDRILYIVGMVLIIMVVRLLVDHMAMRGLD